MKRSCLILLVFCLFFCTSCSSSSNTEKQTVKSEEKTTEVLSEIPDKTSEEAVTEKTKEENNKPEQTAQTPPADIVFENEFISVEFSELQKIDKGKSVIFKVYNKTDKDITVNISSTPARYNLIELFSYNTVQIKPNSYNSISLSLGTNGPRIVTGTLIVDIYWNYIDDVKNMQSSTFTIAFDDNSFIQEKNKG